MRGYQQHRIAGLVLASLSLVVTPLFAQNLKISKAGVWRASGSYSGTWVQGNYAYASDMEYQGLVIIDISDPENPTKAGEWRHGTWAWDVCVSGSYAYLADGDSGLRVIDVSNPQAPVLAATCDTMGMAREVEVSGAIAVVANRYDVQIIDVYNPAVPVLVSKPGIPGSPCVERVVVKGNYAYVGNNMRLMVIDFANPAAPVVGALTDFHAWDLFVSNGALFGVWAPGLQILDISSPAAPSLVGSYLTPGDGTAVFVSGPHAYYLDDRIGFTIVDVSDPAAPAGRGSFHTSRTAAAVSVAGTSVYVVDRDPWYGAETLYVIDVSDPAAPALIGTADIGNSGYGIAVAGRYAYVTYRAGPYGSGSGLKIFDVLDPAHPALKGELACAAADIEVADGYAYLTGTQVGANALTVVNVADPAAPVVAGTYPVGPNSYTGGIAVQGEHAYCGVHSPSVSQTYFHVLDLSAPSVPVLLGTAPKLDTYAGSLRASGKYVYVANWDCGCAVFDVSDPASPFLSGSYGGYGDPDYIVARDIAVGGSYVCVVDSEKRLHILHVVEGAWPVLSVSRDTLYFRSLLSPGMWTSPQTLLVSNTGFGTLQWTATADEPWIVVNPASGTEDGFLSVGVAPAGLAAGSYAGTVTIIDPNATGSPKTITVYLTVEASAEGSPPFGYFDTPLDGTTGVTGAIPVTGWALDDIEVMSVKIFRDQDPSDPQGAIGLNGLVYIGEAVFVEGARPDVEMSGDGQRRPFNYRAGWGYMLLTNMLPGQGNGAFTIYAFAYDLETHATLLGTKTISCDNAHAVKPFGTIDTPAQGGGASGPSYANFGWVLTPLPNEIPKDGSTIGVWIDSLLVGNAVYDLYRKDVAENFPGLNNSNGPVGYYYVDTTEYAAGVHTIWWTAEDGAGNTDGIGSRYFTIANAGSFAPVPLRTQRRTAGAFSTLEEIIGFPLAPTPLHERRGFRFSAPPEMLEASQNGTYQIALEEVELMTLYLDPDRVDDDHPVSLPYRPGLGPATDAAQIKARRLEPLETAITPPGRWRQRYSGYMIVGGELRPLPIGSTLDPESGTFAWLPGPGFLGTYDLVFVRESAAGVTTRIPVRITVKPKS